MYNRSIQAAVADSFKIRRGNLNTAILLAKTASLLKKTYSVTEQEILSCYGVALHLESSKIEYADRQIDLTKNELKILYYLFKHAGTICARADIVEYLWVTGNSIDSIFSFCLSGRLF